MATTNFIRLKKKIENEALQHDLEGAEKALRKAKEIERQAMERQQKLDARGRGKQEKAGLPTISMNTLRNNAERSTARMKDVHTEKVANLARELDLARKNVPDASTMRLQLNHSALHRGKVLLTAQNVNYRYGAEDMWQSPINMEIRSGERISLAGANGSGKTTLIKLILGQLQPHTGIIRRAEMKAIYIDQEYSLIAGGLSIYAQAQQFNDNGLAEHEVKNRLSRFLFTKDNWDKPCNALSGGERMRLVLCCLTLASHTPDMIILDEPTNNLDISNMEILTSAINEYKGTLLVVSHDGYFLQQIDIERVINVE